MDQLATMPAQTVLRLPAQAADALRAQAARDRQRWIEVDCSQAQGRDDIFAAIARAADFPTWFGANLDALFDCLLDLRANPAAPAPGIVFVLRDLPANADDDDLERAGLLAVFRDAAAQFRAQGVAFRVFWWTRDEQPRVAVGESPSA